jgi:fatty aldehyde decarbonylase
MAVENYSDMVSLFDDIDSKLEAVNQARDEGRHVKQLASLGARVGFDVKQRIIEPEWKSIRATFGEAVAKGDLPACLVIQDLMTESIAIVLYQTLSGEGGTHVDDLTAHVASTILEDELEHLEIGIARLRELRAADPGAVDRALAWAHPRVMPQLFSLMNTSCETLCDELSLDCGALDPAATGADLAMIRARAATQYIEAIDAVGFASEVTEPLIAQLAALEQDDPASRVAVAGSSCC